jgi:excisionase family DNA binding protein
MPPLLGGYTESMDELEIKGKKYISSKRAAELTGYAKDYIGQMARSGKLPGMRMGRAWYVEKEALLGGEAKEERQSEVPKEQAPAALSTPVPSPFQRKSVTPATLKALGFRDTPLPSTWGTVVYSTVEGDLIPKPARPARIAQTEPLLGNTPKAKDPLAHDVRIQILRSRVEPKIPERKKTRIAEKARTIRARRVSGDTMLSLGVLTAALGIFLFFSSGFFIGSDIAFNAPNGAYTANILVGFDYVRDFLSQYPPFQSGVHAIGGFFGTILRSFGDFLAMGFGFLKKILDFIF